MNADQLTFRRAQRDQPWTVPYAPGVMEAAQGPVPHILGTHLALHATKSVGKLCSVFEALDHGAPPTLEQAQLLRDMAADLVTAALRIANLYEFDLAAELMRRVEDKNGVVYGAAEEGTKP